MTKYFETGFETIISYPHRFELINGQSVCVAIEPKLSIECDRDGWRIDGVAIACDSAPAGDLRWIDIPKGDPLHTAIVAYATEHFTDSFDVDFGEWRGQRIETYGRKRAFA